ncbi:MAG TPA: twin-arginine translocase TatA/TatE family subunit [Blastocatellia bacterium]
MMGLGMPEMVIILLIILVLFGSRKIPELAKGLGEGIRNFKTGVRGDDHEIDDRRYRDDDRRYRDDERREEPRRTS